MDLKENNLIGDLSTEYALDCIAGPRGAKFNYISASTLAQLLRNGHSSIERIIIVDSRYRYEFNGGSIKQAINIPSEGSQGRILAEEHLMKLFDDITPFNPAGRRIAIFHCEFSSERGPRMYQTFRALDRRKNKYPVLHWPEIYLLLGGYKAFWDEYKHDATLFAKHGYVA